MRDLVTGFRLFGRGLGMLLRSPRLLLIGALPAVLTTLLPLGGIITLVSWIDDMATLLTPFAEGWASSWRATVRGAVGVALVGAALVIGLISFTVLTLAGGGLCYEHIAEKVDDDLGSAPPRGKCHGGGCWGGGFATVCCWYYGRWWSPSSCSSRNSSQWSGKP